MNRLSITLALLALAACPSRLAGITCTQDADCAASAHCVVGLCVEQGCAPACNAFEACVAGECLPTFCGDFACGGGDVCIDGRCLSPECLAISCVPGEACAGASCFPIACAARDCGPAAICDRGACVPVACAGVACGPGEVCAGGACLSTHCGPTPCAVGAACVAAVCTPVACTGVRCPAGTLCANGRCLPTDCPAELCVAGLACVGGTCVEPSCNGLTCPPGFFCQDASCLRCAAPETVCSGGADEDCDGLVDCADPDCLGATCGVEEACALRRCGTGTCDRTPAPPRECRPAAGICDAAESCDGSNTDCPTDTLFGTSITCRAAAGDCDLAERCTGKSANCPADRFVQAGTECRSAAGDCDVAEGCTGTSASCPADVLLAADTECRAAAGICDLSESCTGSDAACPDDAFVRAGTACRSAAGICDLPESCTGFDAACPADDFEPTTTVCRPPVDRCDAPENCPGSSAGCPADRVAPTGAVCRTVLGLCDVAEFCDGSSTACPTDGFKAQNVACIQGGATSKCTGTSPNCPVQLPAGVANPSGTFVWSSHSPQGNDLRAIAAFSSSDVRFFGDAGTVLSWNGSGFVPSFEDRSDFFRSAFAAGPDDIWATFEPMPMMGSVVVLPPPLLHWNGSDWLDSWGLPVDGPCGVAFGSGPNDIWVTCLSFISAPEERLYRWNGTSWWQDQSFPSAPQLTVIAGSARAVDDAWVVRSGDGVTPNTALHFSPATGSWALEPFRQWFDPLAVWADRPGHAWAVGVKSSGDPAGAMEWIDTSWTPVGFTPLPNPSASHPEAIWGSGPNDVWAVGPAGFVMHYDGFGWAEMASGTYENLYAVGGTSASNVWMAGQHGAILRFNPTTYRLEVRSAVPPTALNLNGVWASRSNDVWVVGDSGTALHFNGTTWAPVQTDVSYALYGVAGGAGDPRELVWAVGENGTVDLLAAPHGFSGSHVTVVPSRGNLRAVWIAPDGSEGWAVGSQGNIHFNGISWDLYPSGSINVSDLRDVWGTAANDVWEVDFDGTTNRWNGSAWLPANPVSGSDCESVWSGVLNDAWFACAYQRIPPRFPPEPPIFIEDYLPGPPKQLRGGPGGPLFLIVGPSLAAPTGPGFAVLHDVGDLWTDQMLNVASPLLGVWWVSPNESWVVGENGTILRYNGSGN